MPTYEFWYDETYAYKATFTADNLEEAEKLFESVNDGSIAPTDIPNVFVKDKSYELLTDEMTEIEES
jgi:hypothetical protein